MPGTALPLEFSHGAFRFAHAMVRDKNYQINGDSQQLIQSALVQTSARAAYMGLLAEIWLVQWSYFFNIDGMSDPPNSI